jgi:hypothetical protein
MLIHGGRGGLEDEDVFASHVLLDLEPDLTVEEPGEVDLPQGDVEVP